MSNASPPVAISMPCQPPATFATGHDAVLCAASLACQCAAFTSFADAGWFATEPGTPSVERRQ